VHLTRLNIPLQETGAFNLFAWQGVWIVGLWLGVKSATQTEIFRRVPGWVAGLAAAGCLFFIGVRFGWLGPHLTQQALGLKLDKWQIGPLRVLNLVAFTTVVYWARKYLTRLVAIEPFLTLGKASLKVFCAHLFFVFAGLALLYGDINKDGLDQLHGIPAIALLAITFTALIIVATNEVKKKRAERQRRGREATSIGPSSNGNPGNESVAEHLPEGEIADMSLDPGCEPAPATALAKTSL
jgi:hypothetical protein